MAFFGIFATLSLLVFIIFCVIISVGGVMFVSGTITLMTQILSRKYNPSKYVSVLSFLSIIIGLLIFTPIVIIMVFSAGSFIEIIKEIIMELT